MSEPEEPNDPEFVNPAVIRSDDPVIEEEYIEVHNPTDA